MAVALLTSAGVMLDGPRFGAICGTLVGAGLGLLVGIERVRRGFLSPPPFFAVVGAIFVALGVGVFLRPSVLYFPRWLVDLDVVERDAGTRILTASTDTAAGLALKNALPVYRRAFTQLLGADVASCPVDFVVVGNPRELAILQHAAGQRGDFGFFHRTRFANPVVVVSPGAGWGSIAHHWMYALGPCVLPAQPAWVHVGFATLAEKHAPMEQTLSFRQRSDWRHPDSDEQTAPRDLNTELADADDQGFLRSFFLFLLDTGRLAPFVARLHAGAAADDALRAVCGGSLEDIQVQWHTWHQGRAQQIPVLPAATPTREAPAL